MTGNKHESTEIIWMAFIDFFQIVEVYHVLPF